MPAIADRFWKDRLGANLTPQEAAALALAIDSAGIDFHETASNLGILVSDARGVYDALKQKALVDERKERLPIKEHVAELAEEARRQQAFEE
jgi:hypothetical protein